MWEALASRDDEEEEAGEIQEDGDAFGTSSSSPAQQPRQQRQQRQQRQPHSSRRTRGQNSRSSGSSGGGSSRRKRVSRPVGPAWICRCRFAGGRRFRPAKTRGYRAFPVRMPGGGFLWVRVSGRKEEGILVLDDVCSLAVEMALSILRGGGNPDETQVCCVCE